MIKVLIGIVAGVAALVGGFFYHQQITSFGAFNPSGGGTYRLSSSVGTSDTSINLSSFKEPVSGNKYTMAYFNSSIEYGTLDPQTSHSEFVSFTGITQNSDGTAQLTGVVRGLTRTPAGSACIASTTLAQSHAGQSIFILSDSPCLFQEYYVLRNNATSTGVLAFTSTLPPHYDINPTFANFSSTTLASVSYVNTTSIAGAANSSETVNGIVQLATALQAASTTSLGNTGARLVIPSSIATDTPQNCSTPANGGCSIMSDLTGHLKQAWIDLTAAFTTTGAWTFNTATTTLNANTSIAATQTHPLQLNGTFLNFNNSNETASGTVPTTDGSGNISWNVPQLVILQSTSTQQAMSYATSTINTTLTHIKVVFYMPSAFSGVGQLQMMFNNDRAGNYYYSAIRFGGATGLVGEAGSAASSIIFEDESTSSPHTVYIDSTNTTSQVKTIRYDVEAYSSATAVPKVKTGTATWNNTSVGISNIVFWTGDTQTIPAGTHIDVYGY